MRALAYRRTATEILAVPRVSSTHWGVPSVDVGERQAGLDWSEGGARSCEDGSEPWEKVRPQTATLWRLREEYPKNSFPAPVE